MGLDGGTFASRADVLRRASWSLATADTSRSTRGGAIARGALVRTVEQASSRELAAIRWSCCALTGEELQPPIVACALGALYNRESVLRYLLGKLSFPYNNQAKVKEAFGHITSLRCVFDIQLAEDPSLVARGGTSATTTASAMAGSASSGAASSSSTPSRFFCPIVHCVTDGRSSFVAIRPCGCVVSQRALKNLSAGGVDSSNTRSSSCPVCSGTYSSTVPLNGTAEEVERLRQALQAATAEQKRKKKEQKRQNKKRKEGHARAQQVEDVSAAALMPPPKRPRPSSSSSSSSSSIAAGR
jgi:hypothetical protein